MTLVPDKTTPGLWRDGSPNVPGVHALIIGISAYPHLRDGGGSPAEDDGQMGQLEVSAKTAAKIFDWVKKRGTVSGALVKSCRLLLAPRPGEKLEVEELTQSHYADATFESIRAATKAWGNELVVAGTYSQPNVAFFSSPDTGWSF
jgi:hypothetical protein